METPRESAVEGLEEVSSINNPLISEEDETSSYVEAGLRNPVILERIFSNLEVCCMKDCRRVCKTWNRVATPSFNRNSRLVIVGNEDGCKKLSLLNELKEGRIPQGRNFSLRDLKPSHLGLLIDKLSSRVQSLHLQVHKLIPTRARQTLPIRPTERAFSGSLPLPFLESLDVNYSENMYSGSGERMRKSAYDLAQMLNRSPNLRSLKMQIGLTDNTGSFWEIVLGLGRLRLDKLHIKCFENMGAESLESLRRLNLELKEFRLDGRWRPEGNLVEANAVLFEFIRDQSPWLETLFLRTKCFIHAAIFLTPMNKLKHLEILNMESLQGDSIIPLLNQLPSLESLSVSGRKMVFSVVKRSDSFEELVFQNLKDLKVNFDLIDPRFCTVIDKEYCPPYMYVPKMFPNLKKLSFHIFSNAQLLSCMKELRGTGIEELELKLIRTLEDSEPGKKAVGVVLPPWFSQTPCPSFNNWKQLRKMKLQFERIVPITHVFEIPLETFLPKGLTSLELVVGGNSVFQKGVSCSRIRVDCTFLLNILQGLPLLIQFKLEGMSTLLDMDGNRIYMGTFVQRIRDDPFINPHLSVQTSWFAPQDS